MNPNKILGWAAVAVGGYFAAKAALRYSRWFDWAGKRVIVTGGSRGLGLCLARQLVAEGASVMICSRTRADLDRAIELLRQIPGADVASHVCDVTNADSVQAMVRATADRFGGVDVLINNAGIIQVGPVDCMTDEDFRQAMETHYWGVLHTTRAVLPHMRSTGWGRVLNVASIGGKQAVPHLTPYSASKFALIGLSHALRAELACENILVTVVSPGLMRTGSPRNALFKGQHREEYTWFAISDSLPGISLDADEAASKILRACQYGDADAEIAGLLNLSLLLHRLAPNLTVEMLSIVNQLLPKAGGIGTSSARGYESESAWAPSVLTRLTQEAAVRNNELRPRTDLITE